MSTTGKHPSREEGISSPTLPRATPSLRILAVAPTSFFADYGCHVRIWGHLNALMQRGHDIRLVTYPSGKERPPIRTVRPSLLRRWPIQVGSSWKKIVLDLALAPLVWREALRFRPHLIYAFLHEGVALSLPLRVRGLPILFDYQGSLTAEMMTHGFLSARSPSRVLWHALEAFLDRQADMVLTSTAHARAFLVERRGLPKERVHILPDAVDPHMFRPRRPDDAPFLDRLAARLGLDRSRPVVAYLGLLAPYQGVDVLIEAFRMLVDQWTHGPRPFLLLMGFPFVDMYREKARKLGLAEHVRLTGPVPYDEAPHYLRLARVAVAPKRPVSEGAGKLLPYMATGLPVVATDTPAHRAYLEDEGYYAPPDDAFALAEALHHALTDPAAEERGPRLRGRVLARYTWEHSAQRIENAWSAHLPHLSRNPRA